MDQQTRDAEMEKYEGNYLESADLMSRPPVTLVIAGWEPPNTVKAANGKLIDKPILSFEGTKKQMILNQTNKTLLKAMFGTKASGWVGHPVTIGVRYLAKAFKEKDVPCLRIVLPEGVPWPSGVRPFMGTEKPQGQ